jgi:hypothetical protein
MLADGFSLRPYTLSIGINLRSGVRMAEYARAEGQGESKNLKSVQPFAFALSYPCFVLKAFNAEIKFGNTNRCGFIQFVRTTGE